MLLLLFQSSMKLNSVFILHCQRDVRSMLVAVRCSQMLTFLYPPAGLLETPQNRHKIPALRS